MKRKFFTPWLYTKYISILLKSEMQYKASLLLQLLGRFIITFTEFAAIYFLFSGFTHMKGYTYGDIVLCFSIIQLSFALAECLVSGLKVFSSIVRNGDFDRMLVRPASPILQVIGTHFALERLGAIPTVIITMAIGIQKSQVQWNAGRIGVLLLMIAGGVLLFSSLFLVEAACSFFTIGETALFNVLTYGARDHGKYPLDIYGKGLLKCCTYIVPYALIQYYPLQLLLGKSDNWQYGFYPFGVVFFLLFCLLFWNFGVQHYKSTGS